MAKSIISQDSNGAYDTTSIEDILDGASGETASATNALKSLTTTIVVNTAVAPSAGQVLMAIDANSADWQTLAYAPVLGVDDNYVTDAEKVVIGNTSGTNTGDNTVATALSSATTTVIVSAAAAPSAGQVLTAIDNSSANWATPAVGDSVTTVTVNAVLHGAVPAATTNTALGTGALGAVTTGTSNTSIGHDSSSMVTSGATNTAVGASALLSVITTHGNTAVGAGALVNAEGANNTAVGAGAGTDIVGGSDNTVLGKSAGAGLSSGINNTIIGANVTTGNVSNNIVIANGAGTIKAQHDGTNWSLTGNVISSTVVGTAGYTVAGLAGITAPVAGMRTYVTDATTPTYLAALTGGGAVVCPVFYNGTAWVSA